METTVTVATIENPALPELVFLKGSQALTTSLVVAEVFGKPHNDVLKSIRVLVSDLQEMASESDAGNSSHVKTFQKSSYLDKKGERRPMYLMNRDGFTLLAMGFTGKKALQFKLAYIDAFNKMETLLKMRSSAEWQEARRATKFEFRNLTDLIRDKLIPQMKAEGASDNAVRWVYKNYVNLIQGLLKVKTSSRNALPLNKLYELSKLEQIAMLQIEKGLAEHKPAKEIYTEAKSYLQFYAQISMFQKLYLE